MDVLIECREIKWGNRILCQMPLLSPPSSPVPTILNLKLITNFIFFFCFLSCYFFLEGRNADCQARQKRRETQGHKEMRV